MADPRGFLKLKRQNVGYRPVCERVKDYADVALLRSHDQSEEQASRCMDCGTPFCHAGCPLANYIPDWNDAVFHKQWEKAMYFLEATNNMPEVTGRICPALCEYSCVLGINDDPVTIRENELAIAEYAFQKKFMKPRVISRRTGKKVAVVGSGPSGLSCAAQLNLAGHSVTVFERDDKIGGILRYGIPDFKLEKYILDRRIRIWEQEGIIFQVGVSVGEHIQTGSLLQEYDAVCLCSGSRVARDLPIEGRNLPGIHFAMDYLTQSNRRVSGISIPLNELIDARDKKVVVLGGGDTGSDCVGTAHRQGARCVVQIEVLPQPQSERTCEYPWPKYPLLLKTSTSHQEGGERYWAVLAKKFLGKDDRVAKISCVRVEFSNKNQKGCPVLSEIPGSNFEIEADLVLIAVGFLYPEKKGPIADLNLVLDARGNVQTNNGYMTSYEKVFCAGDMRRGQSLVVWAIAEGRKCAQAVDEYLSGRKG